MEPGLEKRIERSLEASIKEGVSSQITLGILDYYLVPFALFLGASNPQIGLLVAIPNLVSAVSQFFVVDVVRLAADRRRVLVASAAAQAVLLTPAALLAVWGGKWAIASLIAIVAGFRLVGSLMGPAWGSLMSDYLPGSRRGAYLGRRAQIVSLAGMIGLAVWGAVLQALERESKTAAFAIVFAAAALFRYGSWFYMSRMAALPEPVHEGHDFSLEDIGRRLRRSNFVRFVAYASGITFATQLSAAYFSVHMLKDLGFDYVQYMSVQLASAVAGFLSFPVWGRHADLVGNARVLRLNSLLLPAVPVLWALVESPGGLLLVEFFSGFAMAGFSLCTTNYVYDAVSPARRVRALGYFNLINGAAIFAGATVGGSLADRLPAFRGHSLHALFLIAGFCRLAADLLLSPHFREVREVPSASSRALFVSVLGLRPLTGENLEPEFQSYREAGPPRERSR